MVRWEQTLFATIKTLSGNQADRSSTMRYVITIAVFLGVVIVGAVLYVWFGVYNIAATEPHWSITSSLIEAVRERSIEVRSEDIQVPNLDDPKLAEAAFPHYHEMCRLCHGAPGYPPDEFSIGLYPHAPGMTSGDIQKELSDAEIYWIVKHGIKLTGMPAFGPTHKDEQLWGLVALVKEIPKMGHEQYRQQVKEMGLTEEMSHSHSYQQPAVEKDHDHSPGEHSAHEESEHEHH